LLARLGPGSVAVFRNPDDDRGATTDPYRADSDFWYLTGFEEPGAVAVLRLDPPDRKGYVLFVPPHDPAQEQWTGRRLGVEGAVAALGADAAYPLQELWSRLPDLLRPAGALHYRDAGDAAFRDRLLGIWREGDADASVPRPMADAGPTLHSLRRVKDETEIALLRRAVELSTAAHRLAMGRVRPGRPEHSLKAALVGGCLGGGAARMAYTPIVGSGRNSIILHYEAASGVLSDGDLVLVDAACEYGMYAADVTRTYPVSGRFSREQRAIYELVLAAQKAAMAVVRPGVPFRDVHQKSVEVLVDGLLRLGLLHGDRKEIVRDRSYQKLFPHGCSHWLGLDVHDAGSYGYTGRFEAAERYGNAGAPLEAGMVLTVEPGLYFPEGAVPDRRFWNIGVRIEDDVVVTPSGAECLSCSLPRDVAEVERLLAGNPASP
jgi:Xaa-Pro aminopeptidase